MREYWRLGICSELCFLPFAHVQVELHLDTTSSDFQNKTTRGRDNVFSPICAQNIKSLINSYLDWVWQVFKYQYLLAHGFTQMNTDFSRHLAKFSGLTAKMIKLLNPLNLCESVSCFNILAHGFTQMNTDFEDDLFSCWYPK